MDDVAKHGSKWVACVLIDVDGTLIEGPSTERLFVSYLWKRHMLGPRQVAAGLAFFPRWVFRYGLYTANKNKAYLAGLKIKDVEGLADAFVREIVLERLRRSVVDRVQQHKKAGDPVALLTGAPDFIIRPLVSWLGVQGFAATVCARENGVFTARPPAVHPFYKEKPKRARQVCTELGYDLSQCIAYADAIYDFPLLQQVDKPVVVHPDHRLRRIAEKKGWEIIEK